MPKMVLLPRMTMALGGYIRETIFPYEGDDVKPFPYRNVIVGNPTDEPIKIEVPVYDEDWIERHRKLGLIVVPVNEDDDFVGLFQMVKEKVKKA
ncbi:Energy-converting hydrogenase B, subunit P [Methanocaldococcus sp. FS406-22]|jgi:energy-converting hydrogenase B subunit P|uniref:energy-converting hydrogenase B subunit P n=1 Tax=Methanocaldococcus sp. (strain FS406-22) TaxID=644281 RepID=UPI0001BF10A4|nr:energy-converting hydrogenase B subunit P [Methanocaldococcus sp. FS406-22]ADC69305.1 Energy-converting hydrogenase B, subunit P [Methanocaldococcus sp. FS406-22]